MPNKCLLFVIFSDKIGRVKRKVSFFLGGGTFLEGGDLKKHFRLNCRIVRYLLDLILKFKNVVKLFVLINEGLFQNEITI